MSQATALRQRLFDTSKGPVLMPGAYNALSAMAIERAGFEAIYVSGAALANCVHGMPDVGLTTLTEAVQHVRSITRAVNVPVVSDADTGFGESINAQRTAELFAEAGVAGIHIEDQVLPKRCGHLSGKELISASDMCEKVRAAVGGRGGSDLVVIARTDARGVTGMDDAIDRAKRYLDAGADAIFPEAMASEEEFALFAQRVRAPLLANMTEFGKSPLIPAEQLAAMGYRMVIYPMTLVRVTMKAVEMLLADLKRDGTQAGWLDKMQTRAELYELLKYDAAP